MAGAANLGIDRSNIPREARITRTLFAVAVLIAAVMPTRVDAQAWYWCDAWQAYYPYVRSCPMPWRAVNPATTLPQPYAAGPQTAPTAEPTLLVAPSSAAQPAPAAPMRNFSARADTLDEWCAKVKLPSSIAICSDGELRKLALERQHAFDDTKARLNPDQQKALLADQNGWVRSYPGSCGLSDDPPALPLAPEIKNCMAQAGRARVAYLHAYAGSSPAPTVASMPSPTEPSAKPTANPAPAPATYTAEPTSPKLVHDDNRDAPSPIIKSAAPPPSASSIPTRVAETVGSTPVNIDDYVSVVANTGCESRFSDEKKADLFNANYKGRVMTITGEIIRLDRASLGLKILPTSLTQDIEIKFADTQAGYNLTKGKRVTVQFTMKSAGGCILPYSGDQGVVLNR